MKTLLLWTLWFVLGVILAAPFWWSLRWLQVFLRKRLNRRNYLQPYRSTQLRMEMQTQMQTSAQMAHSSHENAQMK